MRRTDFSSPCRRWRRSIRQHTQSSMRQHASAYGSITSAYVGIRQHTWRRSICLPFHATHTIFSRSACCRRRSFRWDTVCHVSIRQHSSAYVSMCQHTSPHVNIPVSHVSFCRCQCSSRWDVCSCSIRPHTSAYVSMSQHTSA